MNGPELDRFRRDWDAFVGRYAAAGDEAGAALVEALVAEGLPPAPADDAADRPAAVPARTRQAAEAAVVRASGVFDALGYFLHNPDLFWNLCGRGEEELDHFVHRGWRELRHPSPGFDLWFYWHTHLDPTAIDVNPVVHFVAEGRRRGLPALPEVRPRTDAPLVEPGVAPRRICLFAAYDKDGVVDPTVLASVRELSRHADVFYLADCAMEPGELDKLAPYTQGRWAVRHGRYDFGSYSMLARDLVGWDVIETYDELVLTNDSCYLVQPMDTVFAQMNATACDWWGLQATYEAFDTAAHERLGRPLGIDEVEEEMRRLDLWRYSDFIHVGSYFLAYRSRVLRDPGFRARLDSVAAQSDKTTIILKYEIGFSRYLILAGYHLSTFVDGILPYHPVYRESAFDLLAQGFPLLKRQFLYENPFRRPDLHRWKERVRAVVPDADVEAMERNLLRVAPSYSLNRSFAVRTRPDGTIEVPRPPGPETFADEERWSPTFDYWWVFPADPRTGALSGAVRAIFEAVADDSGIKKVVLEGGRRLDVGGQNVLRVEVESPEGQAYAMRARTLFVSAGPRADVNHPLAGGRHRFVDTGVAAGLRPPPTTLAGGGGVVAPRPSADPAAEAALTKVVLTASEPAVEALAALFPGLEPSGFWRTGSPRIDLLVQDEAALSTSLRRELDRLRELVGDRRLVVVAPDAPGPVPGLVEWAAARPDLLVAMVPVPGDDTVVPAPLLDLARAVDASDLAWVEPAPPTIEMVWRLAAVLATGSAADLADFAVLGRPAVALTPGTPLTEPADPVAALDASLAGPADATYLAWGRSLHTWSDGRSAQRVADAVRRTYQPIDEWRAELTSP